MKRKVLLIIIGILLMISFLMTGSYLVLKSKNKLSNNKVTIKRNKKSNFDFDYYITKELYNNSEKDANSLISPLSLAFALKMTKEGTAGNSNKELENVLNNYRLTYPKGISNHLSMANGIFLNSKYENDIDDTFLGTMRINYLVDLNYDDFTSPDNINNWVSEKTMEMIPKLVDELNENDVLYIINALAIKLDWKSIFDCNNTMKDTFVNGDEQKDVFMMNGIIDYYLENSDVTGFVKEYQTYNDKGEEDDRGTTFEFIGLLPKNSIDEYINSFDYKSFKALLNNKTEGDSYNLKLPRFEFEYTVPNIITSLQNLGVKDIFNGNANFSKISTKQSLYVSDIIQKTYISLDEQGTKAAAATGVEVRNYSLSDEDNKTDIIFNKPFIFIIKEKNTDNIWFIGTVNSPTEFNEEINICNN